MPRIVVEFVLLSTFCLFLSPASAVAQKDKTEKDVEKTQIAIARSQAATDILVKVSALPEGKGIPKDVTEKMNLIGVIPDAFQLSLLFARGVRGHGVASVRRDDGWSLPGYFFFGRSTGFDMSSVGSKRFDLVLAVVNADIDPPKKGDKASPKTKDKKEKKDDKDKTQAYLYAFVDGMLKPIALKTGVFSALLGAQTNIVYDKALNRAAYGVNGDEILSGGIDSSKQLPQETKTFRETVNSLFPVK
ncbi:MAG TPA: hypothetical protein VFZ49_03795 [Pyrinomonadaceae bacterium]